ncbi:hypothetical protein ABIA39_006636 [Nocardia sp. GAS34]
MAGLWKCLLVCAFDGESRVGDHLAVVDAGLSLAGQVVAQEDRVGQVQRQRLQAAEVDLATAGETDLDVREEEPEQREDADTAFRGEVPPVAQRGSLERNQEFTGTESGSSSRSAIATSTMSSSDSPMPKIAPEHGDNPAAPARVSVSTRSAKVCVVQISE